MAIVLENSILQLTIEDPGKVYESSRFDWTGNISQILLDNKFSFCTREKSGDFDPRQHGQGIYNEFGISKPVGYDDCAVGGKFPKIGVGLLTRKSNDAYEFNTAYDVDPFDIQMERGEEWVKFISFPKDCRGYSVKLNKKVELSGNSFSIEYELENTGKRKIQTNEYCHNFVAMNKTDIDERYALSIPCKIMDPSWMAETVNPENAVMLSANSLKFRSTPDKDFFFSPLAEFQSVNGEWQITHDGMGIGMKESTDFVPDMMNVWGCKHVLSPELFIKIDMDPGQKLKWRRTYEFFYLVPDAQR